MTPSLLATRRFAPLFWCQFFSAFNDNFLKNALVFLIVFKWGGPNADALIALAPDPRLPWLTTEPTLWQQRRHTAVWAVGRPLLTCTYLLDALLGQLVRRSRGSNAYRVLARKNG